MERDAVCSQWKKGTQISTHTLTWSVTLDEKSRGRRKNNFNSHAHVERDRRSKTKEVKNMISTHTLTWSVTLVEVTGLEPTANFNSHAHVERDCPETVADT